MYWECDTNNDYGHSYVPTSMKTLNKGDCDNICNLIETLSVKVKELGANVSLEAHGLKGSLLSDGVGRSLAKESLLTDYQCTPSARTMECAGRSFLYRRCIFHIYTVWRQLTHLYER